MTGRAFDERYDPRFQRGFDGGADASGATDSAAARPRPEPPAPLAGSDRAALRSEAPGSRAEVRPDAASPAPAPNDATPSDTAGESGPEFETESDGQTASALARRWLWLAFGICALAALVSVQLLWNFVGDRGRFTSQDPSAWFYLGSTVQPILLEVGLAGAAVLGIALGLVQAARPDWGSVFGLPSVVGLAVGVVSAAAVVLWAGLSPSPVVYWNSDPSYWTDEQRTGSALAELRMGLVGPALRAGLIALVGIPLIGARAASAARGRRPEASAPTV